MRIRNVRTPYGHILVEWVSPRAVRPVYFPDNGTQIPGEWTTAATLEDAIQMNLPEWEFTLIKHSEAKSVLTNHDNNVSH